MERTFLINFFHTLYFDCFPLPSAPPRSSPSPYPLNFMLSLFKKKNKKTQKKTPWILCWPITLGHRACSGAGWHTCDAPLENTDFPFAPGYQLQITPWLGVEPCVYFPFKPGVMVHAFTKQKVHEFEASLCYIERPCLYYITTTTCPLLFLVAVLCVYMWFFFLGGGLKVYFLWYSHGFFLSFKNF